ETGSFRGPGGEKWTFYIGFRELAAGDGKRTAVRHGTVVAEAAVAHPVVVLAGARPRSSRSTALVRARASDEAAEASGSEVSAAKDEPSAVEVGQGGRWALALRHGRTVGPGPRLVYRYCSYKIVRRNSTITDDDSPRKSPLLFGG